MNVFLRTLRAFSFLV